MKKHLTALLVGIILLIVGTTCFFIETKEYKRVDALTSNFALKQKVLTYEINNDEKFLITNDKTNKNIELCFDNNLDNEIQVIVIHSSLLAIDSDYDTKRNGLINIDIESDLILDFDELDELYKLGILTFKNKTIYNYSLLKYPKIKVCVNEKYKNNIEGISKNDK